MPVLIWLKIIGGAAVAGGLLWVVDEIGDRREAKVRAAYAAQIVEANTRADEAAAKWKQQYDSDSADREAKLAEAIQIARTSSGVCGPSPDLVKKLDSIRPRRR